MIAFIDAHRTVHGIEPVCKVLPIAPSTYCAHATRQADPSKAPACSRSDGNSVGLSGGSETRASRSTGCARCGGSYHGKASTWHVARWLS